MFYMFVFVLCRVERAHLVVFQLCSSVCFASTCIVLFRMLLATHLSLDFCSHTGLGYVTLAARSAAILTWPVLALTHPRKDEPVPDELIKAPVLNNKICQKYDAGK